MTRWHPVMRSWLTMWLGVSLLLGAATTYVVAFALPQVTPVQRYELVPDDAAREAAWSVGYFCARFEAFGLRRLALDPHLGERQTAASARPSAFVRRTSSAMDESTGAELLLRTTKLGGWTAVPTAGAARPDMCYLVASGWPFAALQGRVEYQLLDPTTARVQWFAGGMNKPTKAAGAMVTAPPTPIRLNLGPGIVPLRPTRFGFAANTMLTAAVWLTLFGGARSGRRRLRARRGKCPRCGYDLRQCETPGCPECGWRRG